MIDRKHLLEDLNDHVYYAEQDDCDDSVHRRALDYIAELEGKIAAARHAIFEAGNEPLALVGRLDEIRDILLHRALNVTHTLPGERSAFGYTAMASTGDYCGPVTVVVLRRDP